MTDKFMSGWGGSQGMTNVYVVECDNREQADEIEWAALRRPEMARVMIVGRKPKVRHGVLYTYRHYGELGKIWKYP